MVAGSTPAGGVAARKYPCDPPIGAVALQNLSPDKAATCRMTLGSGEKPLRGTVLDWLGRLPRRGEMSPSRLRWLTPPFNTAAGARLRVRETYGPPPHVTREWWNEPGYFEPIGRRD